MPREYPSPSTAHAMSTHSNRKDAPTRRSSSASPGIQFRSGHRMLSDRCASDQGAPSPPDHMHTCIGTGAYLLVRPHGRLLDRRIFRLGLLLVFALLFATFLDTPKSDESNRCRKDRMGCLRYQRNTYCHICRTGLTRSHSCTDWYSTHQDTPHRSRKSSADSSRTDCMGCCHNVCMNQGNNGLAHNTTLNPTTPTRSLNFSSLYLHS